MVGCRKQCDGPIQLPRCVALYRGFDVWWQPMCRVHLTPAAAEEQGEAAVRDYEERVAFRRACIKARAALKIPPSLEYDRGHLVQYPCSVEGCGETVPTEASGYHGRATFQMHCSGCKYGDGWRTDTPVQWGLMNLDKLPPGTVVPSQELVRN